MRRVLRGVFLVWRFWKSLFPHPILVDSIKAGVVAFLCKRRPIWQVHFYFVSLVAGGHSSSRQISIEKGCSSQRKIPPPIGSIEYRKRVYFKLARRCCTPAHTHTHPYNQPYRNAKKDQDIILEYMSLHYMLTILYYLRSVFATILKVTRMEIEFVFSI